MKTNAASNAAMLAIPRSNATPPSSLSSPDERHSTAPYTVPGMRNCSAKIDQAGPRTAAAANIHDGVGRCCDCAEEEDEEVTDDVSSMMTWWCGAAVIEGEVLHFNSAESKATDTSFPPSVAAVLLEHFRFVDALLTNMAAVICRRQKTATMPRFPSANAAYPKSKKNREKYAPVVDDVNGSPELRRASDAVALASPVRKPSGIIKPVKTSCATLMTTGLDGH